MDIILYMYTFFVVYHMMLLCPRLCTIKRQDDQFVNYKVFRKKYHSLIKVLSWHLPRGTKENVNKPSQDNQCPAEILTQLLKDINLQC